MKRLFFHHGRRRWLAGASLIGLSALCGRPRLRAAYADTPATLLVVGDSLSAEYGLKRGSGWVELLGGRLGKSKRPYQVVNASISGETTAGGRTRIAELLQKYRPAIVIIELGGNDALRGLDLKSTEANLRQMVQLAQKAGSKPLLVGMRLPPNYGRKFGEEFAAIFTEVARADHCALAPYLLEGIGDRLELFQSDQIHPTEQAQAAMLDNVWPELQRLL
jgi:acyl-CoA thioesterase I